jgi:hypothetical protein
MSFEDNVTNFFTGPRNQNSFSSRFDRFLNNGLSSVGSLGAGALGIGAGLYSGLRSAAATRINGTAMPDPTYSIPQQSPTNWGNPFGFADGGGGSDIDDILRQLQGLQDPSKYLADEGSLRAQAAAIAGAKYDPIIQGLRNQAAQATKRGEQSQKDVISIFNQLSDSLKGDVPTIQKEYGDAQAKQTGQFNDLKQGIQDQYAKSQAEQAQIYKDLGIQAAASDVTPQQQTDRDYFTNRASTDAQVQNSALTQEQQGMVDYTNRHSQNARTEGTQRSADILSNLNALLEQYNSNIAGNEAAKQQETMAGFLNLKNQNQQSAAQQAQNAFQNYIATLNVGRNLRSDELDNALKMKQLQGSQMGAVKSIADIPDRIMSMGLDGQSAQAVQNVIVSGLGNELISGGLNPDTGQQATPEAKVQALLEQGQASGLNSQQLNALRIAALEYFGRR